MQFTLSMKRGKIAEKTFVVTYVTATTLCELTTNDDTNFSLFLFCLFASHSIFTKERWHTLRWMHMQQSTPKDTVLIPLDASIDGISGGRNSITKIAFSFSGFPGFFRQKPENWFLYGISLGHDTSTSTLDEIASALTEDLATLRKVNLPFPITP